MNEHIAPSSFSWLTILIYLLIGILWLAYTYAARQQNQACNTCWSYWRTLSWSAGLLVIAIAIYPPVMHQAHHDFRAHMWVHLLLGMIAPLGLVLAAPVTLAMQTLPVRTARGIYRILSWTFIRFVSHPAVALILNVGAMYVLYMTPLYVLSLQSAWVSAFIHWHFLAAGYLFVWSIAGPDRAPRRPGMRFRLFILFVSVGAHATLGKLMYSRGWPSRSPHTLEEIQAGAQLMYYGGDIAELLLIIAFFALWFRRSDELHRRPVTT